MGGGGGGRPSDSGVQAQRTSRPQTMMALARAALVDVHDTDESPPLRPRCM